MTNHDANSRDSTPAPHHHPRHTPVTRLVASNARELATRIVERLTSAGHTALFAGGCVRDLLLGREPGDFDVATSATPDQVRQLFGHKHTLAVGAAFGVIIVLGPRAAGQVEVATFRTEGPYADGRRPDHVSFSTPEADAQRRDFTINGMFFDPLSERVLDYVGGQADLSGRVIRAIREPEERMREDKLRLLRAVRFAAVLGFEIEPATASAVQALSTEIHVVSPERIAAELRKLLVAPGRGHGVELCHQLGLLREILPELLAPQAVDLGLSQPPDNPLGVALPLLPNLPTPDFPTAAAALFAGLDPETQIPAIAQRLRLSNAETEQMVWLVRHRPTLATACDWRPHRIKPLLAHPWSGRLLDLAETFDTAYRLDPQPVAFLRSYIAQTSPADLDPPPLVTGNDLIQLGWQPGPRFKGLLEDIRQRQLDAQLTDRAEALAWLEGLRTASGEGTP